MKNVTLIFLTLCLAVSSIYAQTRFNQNNILPTKQKLIGDFLRNEINVLPGDQLYKAQDLWEEIGSKKITVKEPEKVKGKDFIKDIIISDANELVDGFDSFTYNGKNETISTLKFSTTLDKGDTFLEKFSDLEGQYEPDKSKSANIEFSGKYTFDDYIIKVTELKKELRMDFVISKNASYNNLKKTLDKSRQDINRNR
jgi:hypothetical protein